MKIETRFEIGDGVHFMHENKPRASRVQGAEIDVDAYGRALISYKLETLAVCSKKKNWPKRWMNYKKKFSDDGRKNLQR